MNQFTLSPQNIGLLTTGLGLLEGQGFNQAVRSGLGAYSGLTQVNQLEEERRRREALRLAQDRLAKAAQMGGVDMAGNPVDMTGLAFAAAPKLAAQQILAQQLTPPKVYGDPTKGMYTFEVNPATGKRELQQLVAPQGLGLGSGFQANVASQVFQLGQKIKTGTATPEEQNRYNFLAQYATKPSVRQIPNPDGTVSTVEAPGINLEQAGLPRPTSMMPAVSPDGGDGSRELGRTPPKFSQGQQNAAGFAARMRSAEDSISGLISGENAYDPTDLKDFAASSLPAELSGYVVSDLGKQYEQAKRNFLNSQLRWESGAAISEGEYVNAERQYYPIPGDDEKTIEQKRKLREEAIKAMIRASGGAYRNPSKIEGAPANALFIREIGGVNYYKLPDGSIKAID